MRASIKDFPVDITDGCRIVTEPNHSIGKIRAYEDKYNISTEEMLTGKYPIDENDKSDWILCNHILLTGIEI